MSAKWQGLVQEKLFLAQSLVKHSSDAPGVNAAGPGPASAGLQAGLIQGAVALTLQARVALLVLMAQLNQSKRTDISTLGVLASVLGDDNADVAKLAGLSQASNSWWQRLDALERWSGQPREAPKRPVDDNLIAVSVAASGPDTSPQALLELIGEIKRHVTELCQWHGEW